MWVVLEGLFWPVVVVVVLFSRAGVAAELSYQAEAAVHFYPLHLIVAVAAAVILYCLIDRWERVAGAIPYHLNFLVVPVWQFFSELLLKQLVVKEELFLAVELQ